MEESQNIPKSRSRKFFPLSRPRRHILAREVALRKYSNEASRFMELEGATVHYRDEGEGPVILLLHGLTGSLHVWDSVARQLTGNFRVVRPDLPGFGLSLFHDYPPGRDLIQFYQQILSAFIRRLGISEFRLGGASLGGWIAWEYAALHPEGIRGLVLINPAGFFSRDEQARVVRHLRGPAGRFILKNGFSKFMIRLHLTNSGSSFRISRDLIRRYYVLMNQEENIKALFYLAENTASPNIHRLKEVRIPTLIMWGSKDRVIPVDQAKKFQKEMPDCRVIIYPGWGHILNIGTPRMLIRDLLEFLNSGLQMGE